MLKAAKPSVGLSLMASTGVLRVVLPELVPSVGHPQNRHHAHDVWGHTLVAVDHTEGDAVRRLAALLHDVGKPKTFKFKSFDYGGTFHGHAKVGADLANDICRLRLRMSNDDRNRVVGVIRHHMFTVDEKTSDKAVRKFLTRVGELLPDLLAVRYGDIVGKGTGDDPNPKVDLIRHRVDTVGDPPTKNNLALSGKDVMDALGIGPGPAVGEHLARLVEKCMGDPSLNERATLLRLLKTTTCDPR